MPFRIGRGAIRNVLAVALCRITVVIKLPFSYSQGKYRRKVRGHKSDSHLLPSASQRLLLAVIRKIQRRLAAVWVKAPHVTGENHWEDTAC